MHRLRRFLHLPITEKFLFLQAFLILSLVRFGLWLLPPSAVRRIASKRMQKNQRARSVSAQVWAVRAASRYVPAATCLTQALALHWMLARSGYASQLHLGGRKGPKGKFEAHAWVEYENRIVIGGAVANEYVPLAAWDSQPAPINRSPSHDKV